MIIDSFIKLNYFSSVPISTQLTKMGYKFDERKMTKYQVWIKYLQALFDSEIVTLSEFNRATDRIDKLVKINLKYNN